MEHKTLSERKNTSKIWKNHKTVRSSLDVGDYKEHQQIRTRSCHAESFVETLLYFYKKRCNLAGD